MAWKGLHLTNPSKLSISRNQVAVEQDGNSITLPLEDIAYIVIDTPQVSLTAGLISACMVAGVVIIHTDSRHTPNGVTLPFHSHFRQADVSSMQIAMSEPLKKNLWQQLIVQKIQNQAGHLQKRKLANSDTLLAMSKNVRSGDPGNVEAHAARQYWQSLFQNFVRDNADDVRNAALNYGYAIVRACIARSLVAHGLLPCFGVHHCSVSNPFNLADDVIEPYRPLVDKYVCDQIDGADTDHLTKELRQRISAIMMIDCKISTNTTSLLSSIERTVTSLVSSIQNKSPKLTLPEFLE